MTQQEVLGVVKALEHFHKYIYGQEFQLCTEHSTLIWLLTFKKLQGQTAHWA
jgi:hypothetical protein